MTIVETDRLVLDELTADDAAFVLELLNSPKFLAFIGDRGVRTKAEATVFIETRYRQSYRDHGYGLYRVGIKSDGRAIGLCGFVKRDWLNEPDIGFAFLPQFEGRGYGYESAGAMLVYGREVHGFKVVKAFTSLDNAASAGLLNKLGFEFEKKTLSGDESVNLYSRRLG